MNQWFHDDLVPFRSAGDAFLVFFSSSSFLSSAVRFLTSGVESFSSLFEPESSDDICVLRFFEMML